MNKRFENLIARLKLEKMDYLLICDPASISYLTGKMIYPGERMLVLCISAKKNHAFFLNKLFNVPEDLGIVKYWFSDTDDYVSLLANYIQDGQAIGVDKTWPARFLLPLMQHLPNCKFINGSYAIDEMRMVKEEEEKDLMRKASAINDLAMDDMLHALKEGISENEMAKKLLTFYASHGGEGYSFSPIVGYGPNGADGHHGCDETKLKKRR